MTKIIVAKHGQHILVDDADFMDLSKHRWSIGTHGYAESRFADGGELYRMHRLVMGAKKGQQIDHINGNKLDNRRSNLRFCSQSKNMANVGLRANNTSGYKGVCYHKTLKGYFAQVQMNGRGYYAGFSQDPRKAAIAYDKKARELFGDFALTNADMGLL